jgi:hypothetical protein
LKPGAEFGAKGASENIFDPMALFDRCTASEVSGFRMDGLFQKKLAPDSLISDDAARES